MTPRTENNDETLQEIHAAFASNRPGEIGALLATMQAPRLADLLESLSPDERITIWDAIDTQLKGDVLVEAHGEVRAQLIDASTPEELAQAMQRSIWTSCRTSTTRFRAR